MQRQPLPTLMTIHMPANFQCTVKMQKNQYVRNKGRQMWKSIEGQNFHICCNTWQDVVLSRHKYLNLGLGNWEFCVSYQADSSQLHIFVHGEGGYIQITELTPN